MTNSVPTQPSEFGGARLVINGTMIPSHLSGLPVSAALIVHLTRYVSEQVSFRICYLSEKC